MRPAVWDRRPVKGHRGRISRAASTLDRFAIRIKMPQTRRHAVGDEVQRPLPLFGGDVALGREDEEDPEATARSVVVLQSLAYGVRVANPEVAGIQEIVEVGVPGLFRLDPAHEPIEVANASSSLDPRHHPGPQLRFGLLAG